MSLETPDFSILKPQYHNRLCAADRRSAQVRGCVSASRAASRWLAVIVGRVDVRQCKSTPGRRAQWSHLILLLTTRSKVTNISILVSIAVEFAVRVTSRISIGIAVHIRACFDAHHMTSRLKHLALSAYAKHSSTSISTSSGCTKPKSQLLPILCLCSMCCLRHHPNPRHILQRLSPSPRLPRHPAPPE
jgi:hypothetical protein